MSSIYAGLYSQFGYNTYNFFVISSFWQLRSLIFQVINRFECRLKIQPTHRKTRRTIFLGIHNPSSIINLLIVLGSLFIPCISNNFSEANAGLKSVYLSFNNRLVFLVFSCSLMLILQFDCLPLFTCINPSDDYFYEWHDYSWRCVFVSRRK